MTLTRLAAELMSLLHRRFPQLAAADTTDVLVRKEPTPTPTPKQHKPHRNTNKDTSGKRAADLSRPQPPAAQYNKPRPPFRPPNAAQARRAISRRNEHPPGADDVEPAPDARISPANDPKALAGRFHPTSGPGAKRMIAVNYYLNSPDARTLLAEKQFIRERARANLEAFKSKEAEVRARRRR